MFWAPATNNGCHFGHHCCWRAGDVIKMREVNQKILITSLFKCYYRILSTGSLARPLRRLAYHSYCVDSSNPHRWKGKRLHHHSGGVCLLLVLLWMDLWRHDTIVCKKWYKNNPKEGLCGVTFWPTLACTTPEGEYFPTWMVNKKTYACVTISFFTKTVGQVALNGEKIMVCRYAVPSLQIFSLEGHVL